MLVYGVVGAYLCSLLMQIVLSFGMLLDQESLLISLLLGQVEVLFGGGQIHPGGAQLLFSRRQLLAGLLKDSLGVCK